jgi:hypothetical protein
MQTGRLLIVLLSILFTAQATFACTITQLPDPRTMIANADLILRGTALDYYGPSPVGIRTTGVPDSDVRFSVDEIVKGNYIKRDIVLPGYLSENDDWNDHKPPYSLVRPGGRSGSCYANTYTKGGRFLLVLKIWNGPISEVFAARRADGYTVNWYALGPVNEQLRSADDAWVQWVREQLKEK